MDTQAQAHACTGPAREGRWARLLRWRSDRIQLLEQDKRLLEDAGLTKEDVLRGTPFTVQDQAGGPLGRPQPGAALERAGTLQARGWSLKLYAPPGRRVDTAVAARVFRAALAEPRPECQLGFAVVRQAHAEEAVVPDHGLVLVAWWWTRGLLTRSGFLASASGEPPRRLPGCSVDVGELELLSRESTAWRRHVLDRTPADIGAYMEEDCA